MFQKRKNILIGFSMVVSLMVLLTACGETEQPVTQDPVVSTVVDLGVIAEGEVLPTDDRMLAIENGGILSQVSVEEGDWVQQGDELAVLGDTAALEAQQAVLDLELLTAQQALDDLTQKADVDRELAWQAVLDAQDAYDAAQEAYDELDQDAYDDDLEKAEEEIIDARQDVEDAEDELADYLDLDEDNITRIRYEDALEKAEDELNIKLRAKTALKTEHDRIESQFSAAESSLEIAHDEYQKRNDGPDTDALAQAEAQIDSIQAQISAIEEELAKMTLYAPFAGEVIQVNIAENEFAAPGRAVILLADTRQWVVESTDLTELEVAKLSIGQSVQIEAEAFPGETFTGTVERISSYPEIKQGDVLYTVRIILDDGDLPELRWGMTLTLTFD